MREGLFFFFGILSATLLAADWPQLQRDAAKSGYQAERIVTNRNTSHGGYGAPRWSWRQTAETRGQPIVGDGLVVIGDVRGTVTALDELTGAVRWTADAGSPIWGTLAMAGGKVIAATQAGELVAFSTTGALAWRYQPGGKGFQTSVTISGDLALAGGKDGRFHAVNLHSGSAAWVFQVGAGPDADSVRAPVLCAAAVGQGRVYFGAENMNAYALNLLNGGLVWKRRLYGQSFAGGWAVASSQAGGVVFFRTKPVYSFHDTLNADEAFLHQVTGATAEGNPLGDAARWIVEQRAISQRLRDNPHRRSLWELNAATGADRYTLPMPVLYTSGSGDFPAPPVADDAGGRAWIALRSVYARFDGMGVRNYGELAGLRLAFDPAIYANPASGVLAIDYFPCLGSTNCKISWEDFHKIADEGEVLTAAQNALVSSTWVSVGGIDTETGRTFNIRMYSSDDSGGAGLYGVSDAGAVIANGRIVLRDSAGIKSYRLPN